MKTKIIDGRKIKEDILEQLKTEVAALPFTPIFCDILVGGDPVSASYVRIKAKTAEQVGIKFKTAEFSENITTEELVEEIKNLNNVPYMCGIIVQLPLPGHLDRTVILDSINSSLDVDCLNSVTSQNFYNNNDSFSYPTALACMEIIDSLSLDLHDKKIVVLGQGVLVGRPVAHLLRLRGLDVSTIDRKTENYLTLLKEADVIISAIGRGRFLTGEMIKEGSIIIDAGTSEENGSVVGDVDFDSVSQVAFAVTPSPGGVGPVTVAMLLSNIIKVAKNKLK